MVLHVKLVDGQGDAAAAGGADVPDALAVVRVPAWVAWAGEGTRRSHKLCTTAWKKTQAAHSSHPTADGVDVASSTCTVHLKARQM